MMPKEIKPSSKPLCRRAFAIALAAYLLLVIYWMLFGFGRTANSVYTYNLIPFSTIKLFSHAAHFNSKLWLINIAGNIGVFIPFGTLMPLVLRDRKIVLLAIFETALLALETTQLITKRGTFDVDDLILNTAGALIGYAIYKIIKLRVDPGSLPNSSIRTYSCK